MKVIRLVGGIFAAVGIVLLVVAGVAYSRDVSFAAIAQRATGEVTALIPSQDRKDGTRTYHSRVQFRTAEGRVVDFVEDVSTYPPRHAEGERVAILYDARSPSSAVIDDFGGRLMTVAIAGGLGGLFAPLGLIIVGASIRASRRKARLQRTGRPIEAEFLHVFRDDSLSINGRHPFRVAVQGTDPSSGSLRRFDSQPIWVDPTAQLRGRPVTVFLGAGKEYLVDLRDVVDPAAYAE